MKAIIAVLLVGMLAGCVGNKAEAEANVIKIEKGQKSSPGDEAQKWADAVKSVLGGPDD